MFNSLLSQTEITSGDSLRQFAREHLDLLKSIDPFWTIEDKVIAWITGNDAVERLATECRRVYVDASAPKDMQMVKVALEDVARSPHYKYYNRAVQV